MPGATTAGTVAAAGTATSAPAAGYTSTEDTAAAEKVLLSGEIKEPRAAGVRDQCEAEHHSDERV